MLKGKEYESTGRTETLLLLNDSSWEWIVFISIVSPIYLPLWKERVPVSSCLRMTFFKVTLEMLLEIQQPSLLLRCIFLPQLDHKFYLKTEALQSAYFILFRVLYWGYLLTFLSGSYVTYTADESRWFLCIFSFSLVYCFIRRK